MIRLSPVTESEVGQNSNVQRQGPWGYQTLVGAGTMTCFLNTTGLGKKDCAGVLAYMRTGVTGIEL